MMLSFPKTISAAPIPCLSSTGNDKILDMIRPVNNVCVKLGCSLVVDRTSESVNAADSAEYEDDFEPEESDRSSVTSGPDDGECVML